MLSAAGMQQHKIQPVFETPFPLASSPGGCHKASVACLREHFPPLLSACVFSLQHIQLVEVPGSHFVHMNEPEVVSGIISNFLTVHSTRARL